MKTIKYPLKEKQWIAVPVDKTHIVWHGSGMRTSLTMSCGVNPVTSMIDNWNYDGEKFAMPYVIARNGDVYETFPDNEWAYHVSNVNANGYNDKRSIGILVSNELGLIKGTDNEYYAFTNQHHQNIYKGPVFETKFKGFSYWADFDEVQVDKLIELTLELCEKHKIKPILYPNKVFNAQAWSKARIVRHSSVDDAAIDFPMAPWFIEKIRKSGITLGAK